MYVTAWPGPPGASARMLPLAELTALPGASLAGYVSARRAVASWTGGARSGNDVRARPRGRGPVVLVGGFCTTDVVLGPMRRWLERALRRRLLTTGIPVGAIIRPVHAPDGEFEVSDPDQHLVVIDSSEPAETPSRNHSATPLRRH